MEQFRDLPEAVADELTRFVEAAKEAWGENLRSVVLYGSGAEGRLRLTSDVNVLLVSRTFQRANADAIREPLRDAHAAIRLSVMLLLESELEEVTTAFAVKFDDIRTRHRVLYGDDPFASLVPSRAAALAQLRQLLVNIRLRLRERYVSVGLRAEQLAHAIADMIGPIRACAATICRLQGREAASPRAALEGLVGEMKDSRLAAALVAVTEARTRGLLAPGQADEVLFDLINLVERLQAMADDIA